MENFNRPFNFDKYQSVDVTRNANSLMTSTFGWMFLALLISGVCSLLFAFEPSLLNLLYEVKPQGGVGPTMLAYIVMFAPLAFVLVMSFGFNKLSFPALLGLFLLYSAVNGISLSFIFLAYEMGTIIKVFISAAALFAVMAVLGATTKTDLTKMGSFLMMALFGLIIASLVNIFTKSSKFDYILSFIGVIIFTGLTAYNVQRIKNLSAENDGSEIYKKLGVMSAFSLYLDFINIFLYLLKLFGGRKD